MEQRWEYFVATTMPAGGAGANCVFSLDGRKIEGPFPDMTTELSKWGAQGWELVTVMPYPGGAQWYFKRRVPLMRSDALVA